MISKAEHLNACVGIHLDGAGLEFAALEPKSSTPTFSKNPVPPAALLPFWPGESPRADIKPPLHRRGSGLNQDSETIIGPIIGSGRYPLAFAWMHLLSKDAAKLKPWSWRPKDGREVFLSPAQALGVCAIQGMRQANPEPNASLGLVIPESCGTLAQDALLDALHSHHVDPLLIWRSVVATSWWIDHQDAFALDPKHNQASGEVQSDLIHIHLGLEAIEITRVALVANSSGLGPPYIPGRYRSAGEQTTSLQGPGFLDIIQQACVEAARQFDSYLPVSEWWPHVWGREGLTRHIMRLKRADPEMANLQKRMGQLLVEPRQQVPMHGDLTHEDQTTQPYTWQLEKLQTPLKTVFSNNAKSNAIAVILTGPLANTMVHTKRMSEHIRSWTGTDLPIWIEGEQMREGSLGSQAAVLRQRVQQGIPAWYDTLPRIELVVQGKDDQPTWKQLLQDDDAWVAGGQPWKRPEPISGFSLAAGQLELVLPIAHEEFETVRDVRVGFKKGATKNIPVEIEVEMTPAQGQARLKVMPAGNKKAGVTDLDQGVYANWQSMKDRGLDKQTFLDNMPRAYPPTLPRIASWRKWNQFEDKIRSLSKLKKFSIGELRGLSEALRTTDSLLGNTTEEKQATLASSDGKTSNPQGDELLNQLVDNLVNVIGNSRSSHPDYEKTLIRAIGYTSTNNKQFLELLHQELKFVDAGMSPQYISYACSFCLRNPRSFNLLVQHAIKSFEYTGSISRERLIAISRCLQYRERVFSALTEKNANKLAEAALAVFNREKEMRSGGLPFRDSATLIGYLLRYRMRHSRFLPLDGELTNDIRNAFAEAYFLSNRFHESHPRTEELKGRFKEIYERCASDTRRLRTMGGVVDIQEALLQLLDYVDRKGKGILSMDAG